MRKKRTTEEIKKHILANRSQWRFVDFLCRFLPYDQSVKTWTGMSQENWQEWSLKQCDHDILNIFYMMVKHIIFIYKESVPISPKETIENCLLLMWILNDEEGIKELKKIDKGEAFETMEHQLHYISTRYGFHVPESMKHCNQYPETEHPFVAEPHPDILALGERKCQVCGDDGWKVAYNDTDGWWLEWGSECGHMAELGIDWPFGDRYIDAKELEANGFVIIWG